ncbi:PAS domain-containing protein [Sulfurimonas lithotrophica]|uniref:PAS domain-containing protein n=1 Tax=Sulfurimonas lithotrophica TaxID=2590022 RepID=A0A5P8P2V0_9BACT|nr:PAS domain-containing protein [Sulfurimonas lithotrophica]QFR50039.1 PAS domain-containing protein [Sulfurimonas lithotrophica]
MNIIARENEVGFNDDTLLVTKTDLKGKITYANRAFIDIVKMDESELIGKAHNIIRHPDMPKAIFKLLWDYLKDSKEINAYVKNICKDGSYYWVFANVTPSYFEDKIVGYHSARRKPKQEALDIIKPLYKTLLDLEKQKGIEASLNKIQEILDEKGMEYDEFIISL